MSGFGDFIAAGFLWSPSVALAATLYLNRRVLMDSARAEGALALGLAAVAVVLAIFYARMRRAAGGKPRDLARHLTLAWTALAWIALVILPATPLIAVLPAYGAGAGAAAFVASHLFTTANPRRMTLILEPREAGQWTLAPTHERSPLVPADAYRHLDEPGGRWPRGSALASLLLLALGALGLFGALYPMWLPSAELGGLAAEKAGAIRPAAGALGALLGAVAGGYRTNSLARRVWQKASAALVVGLAFALLSQPFLRVGLPYALSHLSALEPARQEAVVTRLGERHPKGGCRYSAHVAYGPEGSQTAWVCEVPADVWDRLRPGDRVILEGPGNAYGLRYDRISRAG